MLHSGAGSVAYRFGLGDGRDRIVGQVSGVAGLDATLALGLGVRPEDVRVARAADGSLAVDVGTDGEGVDVVDFFDLATPDLRPTFGLHAPGRIVGSEMADRITLSGSAVSAYGFDGADLLQGSGAANRLDGGAARDTMTGGAGNDTYVVDDSGDVVTEAASGGTDTVHSSVSWTLGAQLEHLVLGGTTALAGTGNTLANQIQGNAGANLLNGGPCADTLSGSHGDDTYVVDSTADLVIEATGQGVDSVQSAVSWALGSHLEHLLLTGTAAIQGTGNELANRLTGNAAANRLSGAAGHGTLDGGAGVDTLIGGAGDDVYVVDVAGDIVQEAAGEGIDRILAAVTTTLGANVEHLALAGNAALNGTGNAADNELLGNAAANVLSGLAGADVLDGGAGNDTLIGGAGGDRYRLGTGSGVDVVQENDGTAGVTDRIEFAAGIGMTQVAYVRSGNDLLVQLKGTTDQILVKNWALGAAYRVEAYVHSDGQVTTDAQVQQLIGAMAAFAGTASSEPLVARTSDVRLHERWAAQPS